MDSSFVTVGDTLTVKEAINKSLPYLLDANQQLFEIDSDSTPRLIHLRITRASSDSPWTCSLQNYKLSDIKKIYDIESENKEMLDPPRVVSEPGGVVVGPRAKYDEVQSKPPYPGLGKIIIRGGANAWDGEPLPPFAFANIMYDWTVNTFPFEQRWNYLMMKGQQRYRTNTLGEKGTYIIPICYHRTTAKGFESIQVLRSDASFWPMPIHQSWSIQDNWQNLWRSDWTGGPSNPSLNPEEGFENNIDPDILSPSKASP